MSASPPVSVIIVSRGRPDSLKLCLLGVSRLVYAPFEVVVVADAAGIAAARSLPFAGSLKLVGFDVPNISEARNLGVTQAGGEVVAFIDDDAVPEPLWLQHLTAPFSAAETAATGGFVRGRNGISFQWQARAVNALGEVRELSLSRLETPELPAGEAIKLEGTNMAFRRSVLADMGGFDPAFRFYKDETDLCMRLARAGQKVVLTPLAEVHHAYAPSPRRKANRAVRDLTEIGASSTLFLRKHALNTEWPKAQTALREEQLRRLEQQHKARLISHKDIARLMQTYDAGCVDADLRVLKPLSKLGDPAEFRPYSGQNTGQHHIVSGRLWSARRLKKKAGRLAAAGHTVSLFLFSHTALFHSTRFQPEGYWKQRGGLFGRSDRTQPLFRLTHLAARVRQEAARVEKQRGKIS